MQTLKQFGFPRPYKVTQADAFASALRMRICARSGTFVLQYLAHQATTPTCEHAQLALVIPKRYAKRATLRNQLKRLIRESFRMQVGIGALPAGIWLVRIQSGVQAAPMTLAQKKLWANDLTQLWQQGQDFARSRLHAKNITP